MTDKVKTAIRQANLKARREAQGMVRRPYWATPEVHDEVLKPALAEAMETRKMIPMANKHAKDYEAVSDES